MKYLFIIIFSQLSFAAFSSDVVEFTSSEYQTNLIELYTSEGCSSCPPADLKIAQLKSDPNLWKTFIPMAFHVDYWDYLGWKDRFAQNQFSLRQRIHKNQSNLSSVYTPGFVVNGSEFRAFRNYENKFPQSLKKPGVLKASLVDNKLSIHFANSEKQIVYNYALLAMNITSNVTRGENTGKQLNHEFVVLDHQSKRGNKQTIMNLLKHHDFTTDKLAIAIWVNPIDSLKPIQAVGGLLAK